MSTDHEPAQQQQSQQLTAAYQAQRIRLNASVAAAASQAWGTLYRDRGQTITATVALVAAGLVQVVRLVEAYLTAEQQLATGEPSAVSLDPENYTIQQLRGGIPADQVYARPFGAYGAFLKDGSSNGDAVQAAQASISKLAATDMQLAQTRSASDWLQMTADAQPNDGVRIVGYRRVLNPPSCKLCTLAASRTYRVSDLMPIHERCDCTVQPLWGSEPVASVGTTVRVEDDPEIGPRLMADSWSNVGPRLTL